MYVLFYYVFMQHTYTDFLNFFFWITLLLCLIKLNAMQTSHGNDNIWNRTEKKL